MTQGFTTYGGIKMLTIPKTSPLVTHVQIPHYVYMLIRADQKLRGGSVHKPVDIMFSEIN
jgi:hypothetical protein